MIIRTHTWNKDSNELFDYESTDLVKNTFTTNNDGYIVRIRDDIKIMNKSTDFVNYATRPLLYMDCDNNQFFLKSIFESKNHQEMPWISLRFLRSRNNTTV